MMRKTGKAKVAIVTGAARGIGLAIARKFLSQNYRVALLDIDAATLAQTAKSLGDVLALECDVADPKQVKASIDQVVTRLRRIDALVNNAGIAVFKPLLETTFEEWQRVLAVNLNGPFLCTQACAPVMLKSGGGAVVFLCSEAASYINGQTLAVDGGFDAAGIGLPDLRV